jgi:tubulin-specific chaperone E
LESKKILDVGLEGLFKNLKVLVLIKMELTWSVVSSVLNAFPMLEELVLCRNDLNDYENLVIGENLKNLQTLNLEDTNNENFKNIHDAFGILPNLQKLVLNRNRIS